VGRTTVDPRGPLVIDTRDLGRRAGSLRPLRRTVEAPAGLGLEIVAIRAGAPLELDLRLEAVTEGVLVSGTVRGTAEGECGRCLEPVRVPVEVELRELYVYPERDARHAGPESDPNVDEDTDRLQGDYLDLEPRLRDAVVLALPLQPLCREDCPGLCAECGIRLDEAGPEHRHDVVDPRWSALAGIDLPVDEPADEMDTEER
jgi:DUF177 domain-containing protein